MSTTEPFMPTHEPVDSAAPESVDAPESTDVEGDRDGAVDILPGAEGLDEESTDAPRSDHPGAGAEEPAFRTPTPGDCLTADELETRLGDGA
jgi:hypothetical protein